MKCEQLKEMLPDYWSGALDQTGKAALEAHLAGCALCQREFEQLGSVWRKMGAIPEERPSAAMRARFEATLEAYEHGLQQARRVERRKKLDHWLAGWWPQQPAFQFGFAVAFLAVGLLVGHSIGRGTASPVSSGASNIEITRLQEEIHDTRQLVTLSMLQQQSAGDRLQGVNSSYQIRQPDPPVLDALLHAVNYDQNVNVRLAAVDALHRPASTTEIVRKRLIESLQRQDSPMVQIALIDLLVEIKEKEAREPLRELAAKADVNAAVRTRATWALERIQ
ncbi:MAG: HEAT repeat domain-containing protein [Candidatus Solibacter usitatus]|nr:HEAT repeat domain-containing protein [Candidatus Solibacter usitatus]